MTSILKVIPQREQTELQLCDITKDMLIKATDGVNNYLLINKYDKSTSSHKWTAFTYGDGGGLINAITVPAITIEDLLDRLGAEPYEAIKL